MKLLVLAGLVGFVALLGCEARKNHYYSESNWNVQSRNGQTDDRQNKPTRQYNQDYSGEQNQRTSQIHESFNQQYGQLDQQNWNNYKQIYQNVGLLSDLDSDWSSISQSKSQADYVTKHAKGDAAYEVERNIARKMVKIYNIIQKYAAKNGTVLTNQAQDPLPLRQWAVPTSSHQFLNMYAGKISGLSQGILQSMYFGNKQNIAYLEYFFNSLLVRGDLKASAGPKGSYDLIMTNAIVNVSTDLENRNRNHNFVNMQYENTEFSSQNIQDSSDGQSISENIETKYVPFLKRAIENEMIKNSYRDLAACLKSETETEFELSPTNKLNFQVENTKSQLTVAVKSSLSLEDYQVKKIGKIVSVAFRQNEMRNGNELMVNVVLAQQPKWQLDIVAQKAHQSVDIKNVDFYAENIVATVVMEHAQHNGDYEFNVKDVSVQYEGLKFDIAKFDIAQNMSEPLAREVGYNLREILENGLSSTLKQLLYQEQQTCQQHPSNCNKCIE